MQKLSLLPLFLDLREKAVVIAGDCDGLIWKVQLVAAAGANVTVFVSDDKVMGAISEHVCAHQLKFVDRLVVSDDLVGASFAIGAFSLADDCVTFSRLARAAGVLVNIVDRPALSDVQFGAIVNRSPIVAAIATDGKAPSLGRAIRNRIEALLPPEIAQWADQADIFRPRTAALTGAAKRQFWADYAGMALSRPKALPDEGAIAALLDTAERRCGELIFIDVGPPHRHDLITLEALGYMQRGDLIIHESDVDLRVLDVCRREALFKKQQDDDQPSLVLQAYRHILGQGGCVVWLHTKGNQPEIGAPENMDIKVCFLGSGS